MYEFWFLSLSSDLAQNPLSLTSLRRLNSVFCDICFDLIDLIERLVNDQKIEEEIAQLLDQYCQGFPAPIPVICTSVVDEYLPIILQLLAAGLAKSDICAKIGFCSSSRKSHSVRPQGIFCDFCQSAIEKVKELLDQQQTRDEIREYLVNLCEDLPPAYASLCAAYVNAYTDVVIDALEAEIDPLEICGMIGLCESRARRPIRVVGSPACDMCQDIVAYVELVLQDTKVVAEVIAAVDAFCQQLPFAEAVVCEAATQYIPEIIADLEAGIASLDICARFNFCQTVRS